MVQAGEQFSETFLKDNIVVFDGGKDHGTVTIPLEGAVMEEWECIHVNDGPLVICEPPNSEKGLMFVGQHDNQPRFILLPRRDAIAINPNGREVCASMAAIAKKQSNLVRGSSKTIFGGKKYCCVGAKANRKSTGVTPGLFKLNGIGKEDWNCVVRAVERCEHAFYSYVNSEAIAHIREVRRLIPWEGIQLSDEKDCSNPNIYNGIAFGVNVFLRAHIDDDFTYSVIQVHVNDIDYCVDDEFVCYFCFPRLGIAVPLRPGDFLLVSALEYHCISS
jgi:hypothetical protein